MSIIVYTALFGNYDKLSCPYPEEGVRYICFTDELQKKNTGWELILIDLKLDDNIQKNRYIKFFPEKFLPECDITVYIDSNIIIYKPISCIIGLSLSQYNIALPKHPIRNSVIEEFDACIKSDKISKADAIIQLNEYLSRIDIGKMRLTENNVIIRRFNVNCIIELQKMWWDEFQKGTKRDQLSLQYCAAVLGVEINILAWNSRKIRVGLLAKPHRNSKITDWIKFYLKYLYSRAF